MFDIFYFDQFMNLFSFQIKFDSDLIRQVFKREALPVQRHFLELVY
jgi:hypothetical protein